MATIADVQDAPTTKMPTNQRIDETIRTMGLLSNETRFALAMVLYENGEQGIYDLAEEAGYPSATAIRALSGLIKGGLIEKRRDGRTAMYAFPEKNRAWFGEILKLAS